MEKLLSPKNKMKVLITRQQGFVGKNLSQQLNENEEFSILAFTRDNSIDTLQDQISQSDAIVHLAGENRPDNVSEYKANLHLTELICQLIKEEGRGGYFMRSGGD